MKSLYECVSMFSVHILQSWVAEGVVFWESCTSKIPAFFADLDLLPYQIDSFSHFHLIFIMDQIQFLMTDQNRDLTIIFSWVFAHVYISLL